ncbi:MAG: hypothetical protein IJ727_08870, partial [Treponema sp.]|nr:hypothetical protein [Treponema sp.]
MKKSLAKAGAFALALSLSLWLSSCSDDDSSSSTLSSENVVTLNELVIKANAYVAADKSLTALEAKIAEAEKILESNDSDSEAQAAISSLASLIEAANSTKISDESFSDIAGSSKSRSYKGLFNPTILKEDYDSVWLKYITPLVGEDKAEETAKMLKSSISAPTYGKNVSSGQTSFNCELHPEDTILTFAASDEKLTLSDGTNNYSYEYLGISYMGKNDDWNSLFPGMIPEGESFSYECAVYKAKEENAGEYKYLLLLPDTPEETYHIEFRYGSNINDLQKALTGEYAFWLAAGIPQDADADMIDSVIKLFVTENLSDMADYSYALVNIPFESFFEDEALEFDAYSSATTKAANGAISYGTYHTQTNASEAVTGGITYPVKIATASLPSLTGNKITDDTASFEITTTGRGASTTRYSGKQNLFQSPDYSYYLLEEEPAYYKELSVADGKISAGKIVGEAKEITKLYVTISAGEAHHDFSPSITLYVDDEENPGKVTKLTFNDESESAQTVNSDNSTSETQLSALKAILANDSEGKSYGLTVLSNIFWRKSQIGFKAPEANNYYPQHALVGKEVKSLTFITEKGLYKASNITVGTATTDSETNLTTFTANEGEEAKF